jgi:hypothetical protein
VEAEVPTPSVIVRILVVVEVVLCFALPGYFLLWGLITLPIWFLGATSGVGFAVIDVLSTIGGCLGIWAVVKTLRFYLARRPVSPPNWTVLVFASLAGIISIWTEMTGQFAGFVLDWFSVISTIAPTACAIHILYLAMRKLNRPAGLQPQRAQPER